MANRRMFTKKVTDDDNFMALSSSAQALYLHLSMSADDDGFSNQVSISMFKAHASIQDLQALLEKRYIYQFENGVIVIKHWRMANALRKDRYSPTAFQEELAQLGVKENGAYTWLPDGCQTGAKRVPQDRIGKDRLGKDSIGEVRLGEDKVEVIQYLAGQQESIPTLLLVDGTEWNPEQKDIQEWQKFYNKVDIFYEIGRMRQWCINNPKKRKTAYEIRGFVTKWLDQEQRKTRNKQVTGEEAYYQAAMEAINGAD